MNASDDRREQKDSAGLSKEQASACGPECGCHAVGGAERTRWVLGVVVLTAAAALAMRALMKGPAVSADKTAPGFAIVQAAGQKPSSAGGIAPATNDGQAAGDRATGKEISALSELNTVAADTNAVFIILPDGNGSAGNAPMAHIRSAVRTLEASGGTLGVFTLRPGGNDYAQITTQVAAPAVLAMVKGRGIRAVSGEITEAKLIQAFVGASRAGGCGPASGSGCCPR